MKLKTLILAANAIDEIGKLLPDVTEMQTIEHLELLARDAPLRARLRRALNKAFQALREIEDANVEVG